MAEQTESLFPLSVSDEEEPLMFVAGESLILCFDIVITREYFVYK